MKHVHLLYLLLIPLSSFGQKYVTPDGDFMDTTSGRTGQCIFSNAYYYQVKGKYPKSSETLLSEVEKWMQTTNLHNSQSGYITFRFEVDCEGHPLKKVRVFQTDEYYKDFHFDKAFVNELYNYSKTLDSWKIAKHKTDVFYYTTLITFKIHNGKVVNIIP